MSVMSTVEWFFGCFQVPGEAAILFITICFNFCLSSYLNAGCSTNHSFGTKSQLNPSLYLLWLVAVSRFQMSAWLISSFCSQPLSSALESSGKCFLFCPDRLPQQMTCHQQRCFGHPLGFRHPEQSGISTNCNKVFHCPRDPQRLMQPTLISFNCSLL